MTLSAKKLEPWCRAPVAESAPLPPEGWTPAVAPPPQTTIERLYQSQKLHLLRFFARRMCREEAFDLVQESFTRFAGADQAPEKPEAYLNQIAINVLRNRARAAYHRSVAYRAIADDQPIVAPCLEASLEARDALDRLEAALMRLSPKTREIFLAHRIDGLSYKQIGEAFGLGIKGVEWHMTKAIAHVARAVGPR